ncbi:MAG: hypothetical protein EP344_14430 [Bacteroidetes bacterium]|nr:MAG: hypothetical protein EP344_14430 [Bacteroidota bacterium]
MPFAVRDVWDVVISGDPPVAAWPYFRSQYAGLHMIRQPSFTAYAGPWLAPPSGDSTPYGKLSFEHLQLNHLISALPATAFLQLTFRPELQNGLPFYWACFQQTTRYTNMLPPVNNPDTLHACLAYR